MKNALAIMLFTISLLAAMILLLELGRRIGVSRRKQDPKGATSGIGAIDGAVFGLLGLLIAFTFSSAAARFDTRRQLIVQEANAIGTAYLRLDLLPAASQPALREKFRNYLDARLAVYGKLGDPDAAKRELARSAGFQSEIWGLAVAASQQARSSSAMLLVLPALNEMIDITTARTVAAQTHQPPVIHGMLTLLALACSVLAGYIMSGGRRNWLHMVGFALLMTLAVFLVVDLEYPRVGLIRIDAVDQVLADVRAGMK